MRQSQIVLDILAIMLFLFTSIIEHSIGYFMAALWAVIALMAHIQLLDKK